MYLRRLKNLRPSPPKQTRFQDLIKKELVRRAQSKATGISKAKPGFSPTSLSTPCLRKIFYKYLRVPVDYLPSMADLLKFAVGNACHAMVKEWLRKTPGINVVEAEKGTDKEFKIFDAEHPLSGYMDSVVIFDGKIWILEIKSKASYKHSKMTEAETYHLVQAMIYAFYFEVAFKAGMYAAFKELDGLTEVGGVLYVYVNRDSGALKEYWVTKNPQIFNDTMQKIEDVKLFVLAKELPPKTEDYCSNCEYRVKCAKEFNPLSGIIKE